MNVLSLSLLILAMKSSVFLSNVGKPRPTSMPMALGYQQQRSCASGKEYYKLRFTSDMVGTGEEEGSFAMLERVM